MSWKDNLRPASFRGVPFHVSDRELESGRRIELHEFPKRDSPYPEDMGKASREWSVDAYVIGDDYMARRDRLLRACEQLGPGQYVDHWGLGQTVVCRKVKVSETSAEGRFCKLRLDLVEAGGGNLPVALPATGARLTSAAGALSSAARGLFEALYKR